MFIDSDLRWNSHVDYVYKKACKKLYSLRILRRAGVDQASMLKVYTSSVRSLLEYAVPVWQSIPGYLSDKIESIQYRTLKIIFPSADSYSDALELTRVKTLAYRRDNICKEYMYKMKDLNHLLHSLLPIRQDNTCSYTLRHKSDQRYFQRNITTCKYFKYL